MAKQTINIGTTANDGTGDPIRTAFDKVNDNFTELYTDDAGDVNSITATAPIERDSATGAVTISLADNGVSLAKMAGIVRGKFIYGDASGDPAYLAAGANGKLLVADANGDPSWTSVSGDATLSAGAVTIANDAVTSAKLGVEYTESGALVEGTDVTVDCSTKDIFTLTPAGNNASDLDFTNVVTGMTKTIIITGAGGTNTVTFGSINGSTGTFNRISGTYSDTGSAKNLVQVKFISTSEAWYTISQIAS